MEHKPLSELSGVATVQLSPPKPAMTRQQRLGRWAEALERDPKRTLRSLEEIEWKSVEERRAVRADESPLTVAFEDPVLRAEGLAGDRLGDAIDFFELSDSQAHYALCSCFHGHAMQAGEAARRVRGMMRSSHGSAAMWSGVGAVLALPVLVRFLA
jgi:hypothetical protein